MEETSECDTTAEYDQKHGDPAKADVARETGLTEGANKPPSAPEPFKNLRSE